MTEIRKPVSRVTTGSYQFRGGERREIVATLAPGDVLALRFKGTREVYTYPLYSVMLKAMLAAKGAELAARKQARKEGVKFNGAQWRRRNLRL